MLTLYSYPGLFGVADNNAYGLKVGRQPLAGRIACTRSGYCQSRWKLQRSLRS